MAHVSPKKTTVVADMTALMREYPIIGALNMEGLPARQLQTMRARLRDTCVIRMTKRRLMKVAINDLKQTTPGIEQLEPHLKGMPALLFTRENPFTLYKILKKNKSPAPAKAGQEAPRDITVPAGPTPFAPGPIIGELGKFGIKTGVEGGKVAVKDAKMVCKEGAVISAELAGLLTRLQIYPMEVGLDLVAVFEEGNILTRSVLDIDEDQFLAELTGAAAGAFNLGINAAIPNAQTIPYLIAKAAREARSISAETGYVTPETAAYLLSLAHAGAAGIASHLPEDARPAGLVVHAVPEPEAATAQPEQPTKDEKPDEGGDVAAGMGALFG